MMVSLKLFITKNRIFIGEIFEILGLSAEECDKVVASLEKVASKLDCSLTLLRTKELEGGKETRDFLIRRRLEAEADFCEVRIAVVGNVDAGKSTLLGVLTHNCLDNGRGHARQKLFRHKHEIETGRTSSVGNEILGFDSNGQVIPKLRYSRITMILGCKYTISRFIIGLDRYL